MLTCSFRFYLLTCTTGKFTYLLFVLTVRCLARLPTLFIQEPSRSFVYSDQGAFIVQGNLSKDLCEVNRPVLPPNAWCLAGGVTAAETQSIVNELDILVIHTSEPVSNFIDRVARFCMKPWSLEELIVGYVKPQSFSILVLIILWL